MISEPQTTALFGADANTEANAHAGGPANMLAGRLASEAGRPERRLAFIFPGQGSQAPGMGKALAESFPEAGAVFAEADEILRFPLSDLCFAGTETDLRPTEVAQPALLTCSIAALRCVERLGIVPDAYAGHSLGEYSAIVAAGVMRFSDALRLVRTRGLLMAEAGNAHPGAMAAVLGLDADRVSAICDECRDAGVVTPANFNSPGQVVISGEVEAVRVASDRAKAMGASRVAPLAVSGAFHSPLMAEAGARLQTELQAIGMKTARAPVVTNATARASTDPDLLRQALERQMVSSVRWEESVRELASSGIRVFVEIGPGRVLAGLVRRIVPEASTVSVGDPSGISALEALISGPAER